MASAAEKKAHIIWSAGEAQIEASAELVSELRKMVNQEACSDVVFLGKDRQPVYGCRLLLAGRSDVFKSMLMNGMAESELSEINVPEISSAVLLSVFEFLYTGTMLDYPPLAWPMGFEIISAARFFLLPKLEILVRKFLLAQASEVTDLPKAALMLTEAMVFKILCDETNVILQELVTTLGSNWLQPSHACNLSEEAVDYLLIHTKNSCADDNCHLGELSLKEYLQFRQVMLWWACQNCSRKGEAEELINLAVPDEKEALCLWRDPYNVDIVESPPERTASLSHDLNSVLLDKASRDSAVRLLSKINWRCIPPLLLLKVIEPLKIISSAELLNAFHFHALRRPIRCKMRECFWEHGACYTVLNGGSVIQKAKDGVGCATASVAMPRPDGVYEWHFVIEEFSEPFLELGFISSLSGLHGQKVKLDDEQLSDRQTARVLSWDRDNRYRMDRKYRMDINWEDGENDEWKFLPYSLALKSKVEFCFRAYDHTCSLKVAGHDCGVAWTNLPKGIYYPAVCLGTSRSGRVSIELDRGFDTL